MLTMFARSCSHRNAGRLRLFRLFIAALTYPGRNGSSEARNPALPTRYQEGAGMQPANDGDTIDIPVSLAEIAKTRQHSHLEGRGNTSRPDRRTINEVM